MENERWSTHFPPPAPLHHTSPWLTLTSTLSSTVSASTVSLVRTAMKAIARIATMFLRLFQFSPARVTSALSMLLVPRGMTSSPDILTSPPLCPSPTTIAAVGCFASRRCAASRCFTLSSKRRRTNPSQRPRISPRTSST